MTSASNGLAEVAFYAVADARYFVGLAGAINSLRALGHDETVYVLDAGLTRWQRAALGEQATIVAAATSRPGWLQKFVLPLERPAQIMVLLDADVLVTRPLTELFDVARRRRVVAFADRVPDRFFTEWQALLDLGRLTARTYVNTGLLVVPERPGRELLTAAEARLARIDVERSVIGGGPPSYPLSYLDQDVLNAVLSALTGPEDVHTLGLRLAPVPPFRELRIADAARLRCVYPDGVEPFALHHLGPKPWLQATVPSVYTRLLSHLLLDPQAAVRVPPNSLPLRLRDGRLARTARGCARGWALARGTVQDARLVAYRLRHRHRDRP